MGVVGIGFVSAMVLIAAIGAQNAYVLRQGIRRQHVGVVIAVCILSDLILIAAGTYGLGALISGNATLFAVMRWAGAAYLVWFAYRSFRAALRPGALTVDDAASLPSDTPRRVATTALTLTWLNPHVYLDTVILLGSLAASHGDARWWFALGAATGSIVWFTGLGLGAHALSGPLGSPKVWRWIDVLVGVTMLVIAVKLALG